MERSARTFLIFLASAGFFGILSVMIATSRYGLAINTDSVAYLAAAENLSRGLGYISFDDAVFAKWTPLFPTILAFFGLLGLNILGAIRVFHALCYGLFVLIAGTFFKKTFKYQTLAVIATLAVLFSPALLDIFTRALSEALFTFLILILVVVLLRYLEKPTRNLFFVLCLTSILLVLQRYAGIVFSFVVFVLMILWPGKSPVRQRILPALTFFSVSALSLAPWLLRNFFLSGTMTGGRYISVNTYAETVRLSFQAMLRWFLPLYLPNGLNLIWLPPLLFLLFCFLLFKIHSAQLEESRLSNLAAACFATFYILFILAVSKTAFPRVVPHYFTPVLIFIFLIFFSALDRFLTLPKFTAKKSFVIVLLSIWLVYPTAQFFRSAWSMVRFGAGGYHSVEWQESPLISWVKENPLDGPLYSNWPDSLIFLANIPAKLVPKKTADLFRFKQEISQHKSYLLWIDSWTRQSVYPLADLQKVIPMKKVVTFPQGTVYLMAGETN